MLGELSREQIDQVLFAETVGRIGCLALGRPYVVPVTYAYDGDCVYANCGEGLTVHAMRAHGDVCFEVEQIDSMSKWRCVIAHGRYEELVGEDAARAMDFLLERFIPLTISETAEPGHGAPRPSHGAEEKHRKAVLFRIRLSEKTGRYEKR